MGTRLKVPDVAEEHGNERGRLFAPTGPGDINLTGTTHAVFFKVRLHGFADRPTAFKFGQVIKKSLITGMMKIINYCRIFSDSIGYIQKVKPHFGSNIVVYRLREHVDCTFFVQPFFHFLIDPICGQHPDYPCCHALGVSYDLH